MSTKVDLRQLAIDREPAESAIYHDRPRRAIISRYVIPALILGGFASIVAWQMFASLLPAKSVSVIPVIASRATIVASETPVFQAAGWIEPRPQPVVVAALTEGIIDEMLVVEGQDVKAGQVVARLIRRDAELEVQRAEADVKLRQADLDAANAELTAAKALLDEPIPRMVELAAAEVELTKIETEVARLPSLIRTAEAKEDFSKQEVESKTRSGDAIPKIVVQRAKSELEAAAALLAEYRQLAKSLDRQRISLAKRHDVLNRQLVLKTDETRRVTEAQAQVAAGEARLQQARTAVDVARLKLERTEVKVKASGRVLAMLAKPGSRLMGIDRAALVDASSVITMYDPASLQVRADVRLEDVPQVTVGQKVRIVTPAWSEPINGSVLATTSLTDIQKNTLQIKIAIDDPPAVLKPDMLVQATFLTIPKSSVTDGSPTVRLLIPQQLIEGSQERPTVWIADRTSASARRRSITIGSVTADNLVEVTTGLAVGDRLIVAGRDSLADGTRITIVQEDPVLGREAAISRASTSGAIKSTEIRRDGGQN